MIYHVVKNLLIKLTLKYYCWNAAERTEGSLLQGLVTEIKKMRNFYRRVKSKQRKKKKKM